jgi:hypothetical protein
MHDLPLNQAVGLLGLAAPQPAQLLAVVAHGDERSEQPLLWQLSNALAKLGYGVTVLDATVSESADNPGLLQLLDYQFKHSPQEDDVLDWNVLPAALGLKSLCALGTKPAHSLQRLGEAFQADGVVLLYAGVEGMINLLSDSDLRPLLSVSCEKSSLLTSYLALKRLLRKARLEPTILNMMRNDPQGDNVVGVAQALRECARNFLNYEVQPILIDPAQPELQLDADMRRLATRLLEHALPLQSAEAQNDASFGFSGYRELSRRH